MAAIVVHLDPDSIAEAKKRGRRFAGEDRLHGPLFGDARVTDPSARGRPARTVAFLVGDGARTDDGAGGKRASPRRSARSGAENQTSCRPRHWGVRRACRSDASAAAGEAFRRASAPKDLVGRRGYRGKA
jgi:hypothetical protein